jgi:hypothetical protein
MSWQDVVLAAGGFVIAAGIIPTITGPMKPPISTTGVLVVVLAVSGVAFATLGLWLTAVGVSLQLVLWGIVLAQTLAARRSLREALAHPVDTVPPLGFEEFQREAPLPGDPPR